MEMINKQMDLPIATAPPPRVTDLHMAVDVSTLSDVPGAVVCAMAWIVFDPKDTGGCNDSFFKTLDWDQRDRSYNWPKIQDWMTKSGMARRSIVNLTPPVPLGTAIESLCSAFTKYNCQALWGTRKVLNCVENAALYCKKEPPWHPAQARDLAACWATAVDLGKNVDLVRVQTEPEDVPMGNAAFITRAVRNLYQTKGEMPSDDHPI